MGQPPHPFPPTVRSASTAAVVAAVLIGFWIAGATLGLQGLGWLVDQMTVMYAGTRPWWLWPLANLINALLVGVPAVLLAVAAAASAVRAIGRAWVGAAAMLALIGAVRAVPDREPELYLALLALATVGFAVVRRGVASAGPQRGAAAAGWGGVAQFTAAVVVGLLVLAPWLLIGAFGGVLETLLAVVAAGAVGWVAAGLAGTAVAELPVSNRTGPRLLQALVLAVTWVPLAAAAAPSGSQLPLLVMLPALGFTAAMVRTVHRAAVTVLVALAVVGPLALVDGEEISLFLTLSRDVPFWVGVATAGSAVLALLVGLGLVLRPPTWPARWAPAVGVAMSLVAVLATGHVVVGQPGWHGERLLVVLADQADLSRLPTGTGPDARDVRVAQVYRLLVEHATDSQASLRAELDRRGLAYTPYYLVNAVLVDGGPAVRAWLSGRADVDRVLRVQWLRPLPLPPTEVPAAAAEAEQAWHVQLTRADQVWQEFGVTGEGIVVGGPDSGVDGSHPALASSFRAGDDSWLDPWYHTTTPTDRNGHGTHTLGIAVGQGGIGIAPGAQWAACANLPRGLGNPAVYLDCLQFMLAPYPAGGDPWVDGDPARAPHVLTNSWGCPALEGCDTTVLQPALSALAAAGIYAVVAAGNTGPFCSSIQDPPALYPEVLTVGAVDRHRQAAFFSSRGPVSGVDKPDLVAPGVDVISAVPGGGYAAMSGTSMATPVVAGVVALMWSANPDLIGDLATTTSILTSTAQSITVEDHTCGPPTTVVGAGMVDAYAAVRAGVAMGGIA